MVLCSKRIRSFFTTFNGELGEHLALSSGGDDAYRSKTLWMHKNTQGCRSLMSCYLTSYAAPQPTGFTPEEGFVPTATI